MTVTSAQTWLEQHRGKVSETDWKLLDRAQRTLIGNILGRLDPAEPLQWEPLRGICPSPFKYHGSSDEYEVPTAKLESGCRNLYGL